LQQYMQENEDLRLENVLLYSQQQALQMQHEEVETSNAQLLAQLRQAGTPSLPGPAAARCVRPPRRNDGVGRQKWIWSGRCAPEATAEQASRATASGCGSVGALPIPPDRSRGVNSRAEHSGTAPRRTTRTSAHQGERLPHPFCLRRWRSC
jgi:hypothetical protein